MAGKGSSDAVITIPQAVTELKIVVSKTALKLEAIRNLLDENGDKKLADGEWLFKRHGMYMPHKEVLIQETICATTMLPNQAIRVAGEEWLVKKEGAYLPGAYEEVVRIVNACMLNEKIALHVRALKTFRDEYGVLRKNGEEWLIKSTDSKTHIPSVYEEVVMIVNIKTLNNRQYCVILDPVDDKGNPQMGNWQRLVKGEKSFFLQPGESLEKGIQSIFILGKNEGLILKASEEFVDKDQEGKPVERKPGDKWMIRGPAEYIPPVEIDIITERTAIPSDVNEGIYVRNVKTGKIRVIIGETYVVDQDEELFEKEHSPSIENHLSQDRSGGKSTRDKSRVVVFGMPHNAAVQIYDYKEKKARVVFGPELMMLGPNEQFTQLSLSGGRPKVPNQIRSLCLLLGSDFMTDVIVVETADHARLQLQLYNWHSEVKHKKNGLETLQFFSSPVFIDDTFKTIASRIRGSVAASQFDDFRKTSARIICMAVFGMDENMREAFKFVQNGLDIQAVEPVDQRTTDALQKPVQMAIEITTNSQEAASRHEGEILEQEAESAAVESTGQAMAEAQSRACGMKIEAETSLEQADLERNAQTIEWEGERSRLNEARESQLRFLREQSDQKQMAMLESSKFKEMVETGHQTLLATSGPDLEVEDGSSYLHDPGIDAAHERPLAIERCANEFMAKFPKLKQGNLEAGKNKRKSQGGRKKNCTLNLKKLNGGKYGTAWKYHCVSHGKADVNVEGKIKCHETGHDLGAVRI